MWTKRYSRRTLQISLLACLCLVFTTPASAITPLPIPAPGSGSYGLEAVKKQAPPTTGASISVPGSGSSFSTSPITVSGICPAGLLVQVYNNGVMVGSVMCTNGSFSLQVSLFSGSNDLTASVFDDLDQTGPKSNITTVNYNNATFVAFSQQVQLTSPYGRRGATPGTTLTWPLQLTGGVGSYALSIDWGDGTAPELKSVASGGQFDISHVYKKAGIYNVIVKATDSTGATGFLQLVALGTGNINAANSTANPNTTQTAATSSGAIMLLPAAVSFLMLGPAFVLGRMSMPKRH